MEFDEWYEKAKDTVFEETEPAVQYRMAKLAWNAALESVKEQRFRCHFADGKYLDTPCTFDDLQNGENSCGWAEDLTEQGKSKTDCPYWRQWIDDSKEDKNEHQ